MFTLPAHKLKGDYSQWVSEFMALFVQVSLKPLPFQLPALLSSSASPWMERCQRAKKTLRYIFEWLQELMKLFVSKDIDKTFDVYVLHSHSPGRSISSWILFTWEYGVIFLSAASSSVFRQKMRLKRFTCSCHISTHYVPSMWSLQHYGNCKCTETFSTPKTILTNQAW